MMQKFRRALAEWMFPREPALLFVRQIIPFALMHAYREYQDMARQELKSQNGDLHTLREAKIERVGSSFVIHWECEAIGNRAYLNGHVRIFRDGHWMA